MTTAQIVFVIALSVAALIILIFAIYVVSTTMWANRWIRFRGRNESGVPAIGKDAS